MSVGRLLASRRPPAGRLSPRVSGPAGAAVALVLALAALLPAGRAQTSTCATGVTVPDPFLPPAICIIDKVMSRTCVGLRSRVRAPPAGPPTEPTKQGMGWAGEVGPCSPIVCKWAGVMYRAGGAVVVSPDETPTPQLPVSRVNGRQSCQTAVLPSE